MATKMDQYPYPNRAVRLFDDDGFGIRHRQTRLPSSTVREPHPKIPYTWEVGNETAKNDGHRGTWIDREKEWDRDCCFLQSKKKKKKTQS